MNQKRQIDYNSWFMVKLGPKDYRIGLVYHRDMKRELAIAMLVAILAIMFALCAMPKHVGATIVILQSKSTTTPVASTTSRLVIGSVYAFPTRNLTEGEKWERAMELQRQIAQLSAMISRLTK